MGLPAMRTRAPMIHAAAPRNHCGHGERRNSTLVATCTGPQKRNSSRSAAILSPARTFTLAIAVGSDAVQLYAMVDEAEAELLGDSFLQHLQLVVDELDYVPGLDVDQMVVVGLRRGFVARTAVTELVP